jgi:hypothetical protein
MMVFMSRYETIRQFFVALRDQALEVQSNDDSALLNIIA